MDESTDDNHAALERFIVDNDDLLALEERLGRFNIFDSLRIARTEIRHSNFLAWLLDPGESHGQGDLFIKAVLMDLLRNAPKERRPFSPIELDGVELAGVSVRREWRNIDLLIECRSPPFIAIIENKVDSGEHSNQLQRYEGIASELLPSDRPRMFVYLTPDGEDASDEDWIPYSYADLHRVLSRVRRTGAGSIGQDVLAFLDHYLRLIGSRFMDDPELEALCRRIYTNHRQAIDLIVDRVGIGDSAAANEIEALIRTQPDRWHVVNRRERAVTFMPKGWLQLFPAIGDRKSFDPRCWLVMEIEIGRTKPRAWFQCVAWPTTDVPLRKRVLERLLESEPEFGFKQFFKKSFGDRWTRIRKQMIHTWDEEDEPDADEIRKKASKTLDQVWAEVANVPAALKPIFSSQA